MNIIIVDRKAGKVIEGSLSDIEKMFRKIMKNAEEKYRLKERGYNLEEYSFLNDLRELLSLMKKYRITKIVTNGWGDEAYTDINLPDDVREKLLELVYNIAWDIDCIFDNDFVSDVYVVPTYYEIEYDHETNVVRIKHETVWEDT